MPLNSSKMIKLYKKTGWKVVKGGGKGSHTKLTKEGMVVTIPKSKELKKGLEKALLKKLDS